MKMKVLGNLEYLVFREVLNYYIYEILVEIDY